ncbi:MAG: 50S ribosomal protein L37e [Candidatus Bathyarchaeia archaeon]
MGTKHKKTGRKLVHHKCRRCGRRSYNFVRGYCAACGFGRSSRMKDNRWKTKKIQGMRIR